MQSQTPNENQNQTPREVSAGELLHRAQAGEELDAILNPQDNENQDGESRQSQDRESGTITQDRESDTNEDEAGELGESQDNSSIDFDQKLAIHEHGEYTLGQIKDLAEKQLNAEDNVAGIEKEELEKRVYVQNLQRDLESIATILNSKGLLDEEVMEQMTALHKAQAINTGRQLATLLPEWKNEQALIDDTDKIAAWAEGYGVSRERIERVIQSDPNMALLLTDNARAWAKVQAKLNARKPTKRGKTRRAGETNNLNRLKANAQGSPEALKAAMGAVLTKRTKR